MSPLPFAGAVGEKRAQDPALIDAGLTLWRF
jgi:hypothetical protein